MIELANCKLGNFRTRHMQTFLISNESVRRSIEIVIRQGYECPTYAKQEVGKQVSVLLVTYKDQEKFTLRVTLGDDPKVDVVFEGVEP